MLAGVRGAQLCDLELLHRPGLRALHRELPSRPPWQVRERSSRLNPAALETGERQPSPVVVLQLLLLLLLLLCSTPATKVVSLAFDMALLHLRIA